MQTRTGHLGKRNEALVALALLILAIALSLVVGRVEWLLAADDAEHPHAAGGAVVVLGYRLDWPEGTPVRPATLLAQADGELRASLPRRVLCSRNGSDAA
jgi:hypothetical protein